MDPLPLPPPPWKPPNHPHLTLQYLLHSLQSLATSTQPAQNSNPRPPNLIALYNSLRTDTSYPTLSSM